MAISPQPIPKIQPLSKEELSGYVRAKGEQIKEEQAKKNNTFYNRVTGKVPLKYNVKNGEFSDTTQPPDDKKGFPKAIFVINKGIELSSDAVVKIIYGAYEKQDDPDASRITKSLDLGILKILEEIAALDFCNILNTSLNKVGSLGFDPENPLNLQQLRGYLYGRIKK